MSSAPGAERSSAAAWGTEVMERLRDFLRGSAPQEHPSDADAREPQRDNRVRRNSERQTDNPIDIAVPLSSSAERQAARGEGQGERPSGGSEAEGGAMGMHVVPTNTGEGGTPRGAEHGQPGGSEGSDSVLGERTLRLAGQLKRLQVDGKSDEQAGQDTQEPLSAATRSQPSRLDYRAAVVTSHYVHEESTHGEYVPLPYRTVVQNYFLRLPAQ